MVTTTAVTNEWQNKPEIKTFIVRIPLYKRDTMFCCVFNRGDDLFVNIQEVKFKRVVKVANIFFSHSENQIRNGIFMQLVTVCGEFMERSSAYPQRFQIQYFYNPKLRTLVIDSESGCTLKEQIISIVSRIYEQF